MASEFHLCCLLWRHQRQCVPLIVPSWVVRWPVGQSSNNYFFFIQPTIPTIHIYQADPNPLWRHQRQYVPLTLSMQQLFPVGWSWSILNFPFLLHSHKTLHIPPLFTKPAPSSTLILHFGGIVPSYMVVTWFHPLFSNQILAPLLSSQPVCSHFQAGWKHSTEKSCPTLSHAAQCRNCRNLDQGNFGMTHPCPALLSRRHVFPWSAVIFDFLAGIIKFSPSTNWVPLLIWSKVPFLAKWLLLWSNLPLYQSWPGKDLKVPISRNRTRYGYTWVHPGAIWPQLLLFVHLIISPQRFLLSFVLSLFWHRVSSPSDVDFVGSTWDLCWTLLPFVINGFLSECLAVSTICSHHS